MLPGDDDGASDDEGASPLLGRILMWTSPSMFRPDMPAGSTSTIPGVWFDVHVLRHRRVLHVYQTVEAGRRLLSSLVWSSDRCVCARLCMCVCGGGGDVLSLASLTLPCMA